MSAHKPVLLFGDLNVDQMMSIPAFPQPGYEGLSPVLHVVPGGSIANTACVLVKLGIPAELVARTGTDLWGYFERESLSGAGVGLSAVMKDPQHATGLATIVVLPDGERTMFSHRGANRYFERDDVPVDALRKASLLHVSGYAFIDSPQREAAWWSMDLAQSLGVPISLDTGLQPVVNAPSQMRRALEKSTICILGPAEAELMYPGQTLDDVAARLLKGAARVVAMKLGSRGSLLIDAQERIEFPVFPVQALDSTGAGDAYSAGLLFSFLHGLSLGASGMLATALGGLATTVWGAGPRLPGGARAAEFLRALRQTEADPARQAWLDEALDSLASISPEVNS